MFRPWSSLASKKVKAQDISQIMAKAPNYISVYRRKLIDDQIIMPAGYGYVQFMLPFFDQFCSGADDS